MTRRRINAITLVVDLDGVEIKASLRRQRGKTGNFNVRWPHFGRNEERSTGTNSLEEARRVARKIIRGENVPTATGTGFMTVQQFEQIQREYHGRNARPEAGQSSLREFIGVWRSFLRVCPVKTVHEVTEQLALKYLKRLQHMSKTENRGSKKKSSEKLSVKTIQKHIRTLAGAWNLVRGDTLHGWEGFSRTNSCSRIHGKESATTSQKIRKTWGTRIRSSLNSQTTTSVGSWIGSRVTLRANSSSSPAFGAGGGLRK